ncbi:MAG: response regulator [Acidimicrobiales bacterium]
MTIRILLVDDQALIRAGFAALISTADDLEVVGEAGNGDDAVELARQLRVDVVLMDIRMPGTDGVEATRRISRDDDLAGVKVIILTTFELDQYVIDAIEAGAAGFVGKSIEPDQLIEAIRTVASGEALLSPKATRALLAAYTADSGTEPTPPPPDDPALALLTPREREVVELAALGLTNADIAERLYLSALTVKTHANRAMMKLDVRDRAQLVAYAYRSGLVTPEGG